MDKRVVPNKVLLEEAGLLLEEGREVSFTPLGNSMLPFIRGGKDSVRLCKKPSVEVGDIVLARLPGRYVLHRVVGMEGERLTLMGDGNLLPGRCNGNGHGHPEREAHRPSRKREVLEGVETREKIYTGYL